MPGVTRTSPSRPSPPPPPFSLTEASHSVFQNGRNRVLVATLKSQWLESYYRSLVSCYPHHPHHFQSSVLSSFQSTASHTTNSLSLIFFPPARSIMLSTSSFTNHEQFCTNILHFLFIPPDRIVDDPTFYDLSDTLLCSFTGELAGFTGPYQSGFHTFLFPLIPVLPTPQLTMFMMHLHFVYLSIFDLPV